MTKPKILTADLNPFASYCLDNIGDVCFTGGAAGGYGIILPDLLRKYILGLLNSKLLDWFIKNISSTFRGGWFSYESRYISKLPMRITDFSNKKDKSRHDKMVQLVDGMLELHKHLNKAQTPHDRDVLQRQINATDCQIDKLVYELYELTEDEIGIVESTKNRG